MIYVSCPTTAIDFGGHNRWGEILDYFADYLRVHVGLHVKK